MARGHGRGLQHGGFVRAGLGRQRREHVGGQAGAVGQERAQGGEHLVGGLEAIGRLEAQGAVDDGGDLPGHPRRELLHGARELGADGDDQLAERVDVLVRRAAGEGLVEHDAHRPDVGAVVDALAPARLLGDM